MDFKAKLTHKVGPIPVWGWIGILAVGFYVYRSHKAAQDSAAVATDPLTGNTVPDSAGAGYSDGGAVSTPPADLGGGPIVDPNPPAVDPYGNADGYVYGDPGPLDIPPVTPAFPPLLPGDPGVVGAVPWQPFPQPAAPKPSPQVYGSATIRPDVFKRVVPALLGRFSVTSTVPIKQGSAPNFSGISPAIFAGFAGGLAPAIRRSALAPLPKPKKAKKKIKVR